MRKQTKPSARKLLLARETVAKYNVTVQSINEGIAQIEEYFAALSREFYIFTGYYRPLRLTVSSLIITLPAFQDEHGLWCSTTLDSGRRIERRVERSPSKYENDDDATMALYRWWEVLNEVHGAIIEYDKEVKAKAQRKPKE